MLYNLNLGSNYVSEWGFWEAIREPLQNWVDRKEEVNAKEDTVVYDPEEMTVTLWNQGAILSPNILVLGQSEKGAEARGHFGEGMKLSFLVFHRLNKQVQIQTGEHIWILGMDVAPGLSIPTLHVNILRSSLPVGGFRVIISDVSQEEWDIVKQRCLFLADYSSIPLQSGEILCDDVHAGKIFSKGIYICNACDKTEYGYNLSNVSTSRDRSFLSPWELRCQIHELISQYIFQAAKEGVDPENSIAEDMFRAIGEVGTLEEASMSHYGSYSSSADRDTWANVMAKQFVKQYGEVAFPVHKESDKDTVLCAGLLPIQVSEGLLRALEPKFCLRDLETSKEVLEEVADSSNGVWEWLQSMVPTLKKIVRFRGKSVDRQGEAVSYRALRSKKRALELLEKDELIQIILDIST